MTEQELTALLLGAFPGSDVSVSLDGGHVNIHIISNAFEGLRPVACQQKGLRAALWANSRRNIACG